MPTVMPIAPPPAAGSPGSIFRGRLEQTLWAAGDYVLNDTNFPGLGRLLPSPVAIIRGSAPTGLTVALEISLDDGVSWNQLVAASSGAFVTIVPIDGRSFRIRTTGSGVTVSLMVM